MLTAFHKLLKTLNLTEDKCHLNEACAQWCRENHGCRYIPEAVLHRLHLKTSHEEQIEFSLIDNTSVPASPSLEELEVNDAETKEA